MRSLTRLIMIALLCVSAAHAVEGRQLTAAQVAQYNRLTHDLIAPCCWREPIAIHRSAVALQMLDEVEQFVAEGRSEDEIKTLYVNRYGAMVLSDPPGVERYWLYLLPAGLFCALMLAAVFRLRALVRQPVALPTAIAPEMLARIRKETEIA